MFDNLFIGGKAMLLDSRVIAVFLALVTVILVVLICSGNEKIASEVTVVTAPMVVHQTETPAPVVPVIEAMPTEASVAPESEETSVSEVDRKLEALGFGSSAEVHRITVKQ
ncbi:MAG: hypothetical protein WC531_03215 [Candidatus Paceibacterota bacterium]|jgi:hypothetical protein